MSDQFGNIPIQPAPETPVVKKGPRRKRPQAQQETRKSPQSNKRSSRIAVWILVPTLLLITYYGMSFIAVPYYLKEIFPSQLQNKTGYTLQISTVEFNPLTFHLQCGPFDLLAADGTPTISGKALSANIAPVPLLRLDLVCNSLLVDTLKVLVIRDENESYNLGRLFADSMAKTSSEIIGFSDLPFFFSFNNIEVNNSEIIFNDVPTGKTHEIKEIELKLPTFSNIQFKADQYIQPFFSAVINGSPFELTGKTSAGYGFIDSGPTELASHLKELDLKLYSQYLPFTLPFTIESGKAAGSIELFFDPKLENGEKLSINFDLKLSDLKLHDPQDEISISSDDATLRGSFEPIRNNLNVGEIIIHQPAIAGKMISLTPPALSSVKQQDKQKPSSSPDANPFSFRIEKLTLYDGKVALQPFKSEKRNEWNDFAFLMNDFSNDIFDKKFKTKSKGSFKLKAHQSGTQAFLSYEGNFQNQFELSGNLGLKNCSSSLLLGIVFGDNAPLSKGSGELLGKLSFGYNYDNGTWLTRVDDTTLNLQKFRLISGKSSIFSASNLILDGIDLRNNHRNLGSITVKGGHAHIIDNRLPEELRSFFTEKIKVDQIHYQGNLSLLRKGGTGKPALISSLQFEANNLDVKQTSNNLVFLGLAGSQGELKGSGSVHLHPFRLTAKTEFKNLPADLFMPHIASSRKTSAYRIRDGELSGKGTLSFPKISFRGNVQITDGNMVSGKKAVFQWENLGLEELQYSQKPFKFHAGVFELKKPHMQWQFAPQGPTIWQAISTYCTSYLPKNNKGAEGARQKRGNIYIDRLHIDNGSIQTIDSRLSPEWSAEFNQINGALTAISSAGDPGSNTVALEGLLDGSPILVKGNLNLFGKSSQSQIDLKLSDYPLDSFQSQLSDHIEIDTTPSKFDLKMSLRQDQGNMYNHGSIDLHGIRFPTDNTPLALSLGVLAGSDNAITFNFSYEFPEDSNISLFDKILSDVQRTLIKGSVSPLLLANEDFNDLIDIDWIAFKPGEFILTEEGSKYLQRFGLLLKTYPFIGLKISGGLNYLVDKKAMESILSIREQQRVDLENEKRFAKFQDQKKAYEAQLSAKSNQLKREGKITEMTIPHEILTGFTPLEPAKITVDDTILLDLAAKRIKHIDDYLAPLNSLQFKRIFASPPNHMPKTSDSKATGIQVHLIPVVN